MAHVRSSSSTARTTADGGLAFSVILRSHSVASVLSIIISQRNKLTPTSTPAHHERSGWGPSLTRARSTCAPRRDRARCQRRRSLGARSWTREREGMGNVRVRYSRFSLSWPGVCTFCESDEGIFVVPWKNERLSHAHFVERRTTDMSVKLGVLTYMRRRSWFPTTHSCAPAVLWNRRRPVAA